MILPNWLKTLRPWKTGSQSTSRATRRRGIASASSIEGGMEGGRERGRVGLSVKKPIIQQCHQSAWGRRHVDRSGSTVWLSRSPRHTPRIVGNKATTRPEKWFSLAARNSSMTTLDYAQPYLAVLFYGTVVGSRTPDESRLPLTSNQQSSVLRLVVEPRFAVTDYSYRFRAVCYLASGRFGGPCRRRNIYPGAVWKAQVEVGSGLGGTRFFVGCACMC